MNGCPLCLSPTVLRRKDVPQYFDCTICKLVFKDPLLLNSSEKEKARYLIHNNDVDDLGYQTFVSPIVSAVKMDFSIAAVGLDFGAGTGPVITKLLASEGYQLKLYDPFFHPDQKVLAQPYDYIVCCEVAEHFYHPKREFELLHKLLKPGGKLYCMTKLLSKAIQFKTWHYRNDTTHVSFYSKKSLQWIQKTIGFSSLRIDDRLIVFTK